MQHSTHHLRVLIYVNVRVSVCTYYNKKDEVDEVVERMCIHNIVHDVYPAF